MSDVIKTDIYGNVMFSKEVIALVEAAEDVLEVPGMRSEGWDEREALIKALAPFRVYLTNPSITEKGK